MKMKCRCGRQLQVGEGVTGRFACPHCARAYEAQRDPAGRLSIRPVETQPQKPQRPAPSEEWPQELELEEAPAPPAAEAPAPPAPAARPQEEAPLVAPRTRQRVRQALPGEAEHSWWHYLGNCWTYPFLGSAKWLLLVWAVLYALAQWTHVFLFGWIGLLARFMFYGVLLLYQFDLIRRSSWDAESEPKLPALEDFYESIVRPVGLMIAVVFGSAIPFVVIWITARIIGGAEAGPFAIIAGLFEEGRFSNWGWVVAGGALLSWLMFPMNLLAVATADSAGAINPKFTFPAVVRVIGPYLVYCVFSGVLNFGGSFLRGLLVTGTGGGLLGQLLSALVGVYLMAVTARALGTLHYAYADEMGWLRED